MFSQMLNVSTSEIIIGGILAKFNVRYNRKGNDFGVAGSENRADMTNQIPMP